MHIKLLRLYFDRTSSSGLFDSKYLDQISWTSLSVAPSRASASESINPASALPCPSKLTVPVAVCGNFGLILAVICSRSASRAVGLQQVMNNSDRYISWQLMWLTLIFSKWYLRPAQDQTCLCCANSLHFSELMAFWTTYSASDSGSRYLSLYKLLRSCLALWSQRKTCCWSLLKSLRLSVGCRMRHWAQSTRRG